MTKSQRAEWEYAIQHAPPHVLKMADRAVMTAFVVAADLHARCAQELAKVDLMQPGARGGGNRVHPLTHTMDKQTVVMTRCAAELGFTPVARVRISLGGGEAEKTGWDELAKAS